MKHTQKAQETRKKNARLHKVKGKQAAICREKERFSSIGQARRNHVFGTHPYKCPVCGGYHLTRSPRRGKRSRVR